MTNFDDRIRNSMQNADDEHIFDIGQDEKLFQLVSDSFRKGRRWLTIVGIVKLVSFLAIAVVAGVQFFQSGDIKSLIGWSTLVVISSIAVTMMAISLYLDLNRNAIFRAIKRLEIRLIQAGSLPADKA